MSDAQSDGIFERKWEREKFKVPKKTEFVKMSIGDFKAIKSALLSCWYSWGLYSNRNKIENFNFNVKKVKRAQKILEKY